MKPQQGGDVNVFFFLHQKLFDPSFYLLGIKSVKSHWDLGSIFNLSGICNALQLILT